MTATARELLRERYKAPAYAYFEEVANGTGGRATNWIDGLAMSLWPSRGIELHGFEIKSSRGDLLRELKNPAKGEALFKYCNRWWLVLDDRKLIQPGELPAGWGLQAVTKGTLRTIVEAPVLSPSPWSAAFFASLIRALDTTSKLNWVPRADLIALNNDIDAKVAERLARDLKHAVEDATEQVRRQLRTAQAEVENLRESIARFERAAGVTIGANRWQAEIQGAAFKLAERMVKPEERIDFHQIAAACEQMAASARVLADAAKDVRAPG